MIDDGPRGVDIVERTTTSASVLLLCGLPASGKSTLARKLSRSLLCHCHSRSPHNDDQACDNSEIKEFYDVPTQKSTLATNHTCKVCFDRVELIDYDDLAKVEEDGIERQSSSVTANASAETSETSLSTSLTQSSDTPPTGVLAWRRTRERALETLDRLLSEHFELREGELLTQDKAHRNLLVVMDDNFHLRSMRREVYKVCQNHLGTSLLSSTRRIGYSVVAVDTSVDLCRERNARRTGRARVSDHTIANMALSIEWPEGVSLSRKGTMGRWEDGSNNVCRLNGNTSLAPSKNCNNEDDDDTMHQYRSIKECLWNSLHHNPVSPVQRLLVDEEAVAKDRASTKRNAIHTVDRLLRRLVGTTCRSSKTLAGRANNARKQVLQEFREGKDTRTEKTATSIFNSLDLEDVLERFMELILLRSSLSLAASPLSLTSSLEETENVQMNLRNKLWESYLTHVEEESKQM